MYYIKISLNNEDNTEVSTHNEVSDQYKSNNKKVKHNNIHGESEIRSWIWHYFDPEYENNIRVAICKVETVKGTKCDKKIQNWYIYKLLELKGYIRILEANLAKNSNQDNPFEEVTRYLGSSNYATYSIISPLLTTILKMLKPASLTNETNEINIEKIEDIFKRDITSYLLSILDSCVKKIEFASDKIDEIQELLKNKYYNMKNNLKVNLTTASTSTISAQNLSNICSFPNSTLTTLYKSILFNIFNNLPTVNSQSELDEYLA
ncbi:347_t:CDS:2, partial [Scutellospora calospora]